MKLSDAIFGLPSPEKATAATMQKALDTLEYLETALSGVKKYQDKIMDDYNAGKVSKQEMEDLIRTANYQKAKEAGIE